MQSGRARRIAIADDSPTFVEAAARYIGALPGYALAGTVHATAHALTLVRSSTPDILLLDLGAAPVRGLELLRRVTALPAAPAVVAMTLFRSPEAAAAASYLVDARISIDPSLAEGRGLAGPSMRENRTIVCNDFVAEPRLAPWRAGARRFGFASVACVPLRRAGKAIAMLALYAAETGYFDPELVTLVERMA